MSLDVEHISQNASKGDVGSTPETIIIRTKAASNIQYETHLSRWGDEPFSVDKRLKKRGGASDRQTTRITPKLTPKVRSKLIDMGVTFA